MTAGRSSSILRAFGSKSIFPIELDRYLTTIPAVFGVQQFPTAGSPLASGLPEGLFRVILASGGALALAIGLYFMAERRRS